MLRMRYLGRCLLLLLLTGVGGLFARVLLADYHVTDGGGSDVFEAFGGAGGPFGAGVGGHFPVNVIMKMHVRPVPRREFQERLRAVRNKFDLLRIFLDDADVSDDRLQQLLSAAESHVAVTSRASRSHETARQRASELRLRHVPEGTSAGGAAARSSTSAPWFRLRDPPATWTQRRVRVAKSESVSVVKEREPGKKKSALSTLNSRLRSTSVGDSATDQASTSQANGVEKLFRPSKASDSPSESESDPSTRRVRRGRKVKHRPGGDGLLRPSAPGPNIADVEKLGRASDSLTSSMGTPARPVSPSFARTSPPAFPSSSRPGQPILATLETGTRIPGQPAAHEKRLKTTPASGINGDPPSKEKEKESEGSHGETGGGAVQGRQNLKDPMGREGYVRDDPSSFVPVRRRSEAPVEEEEEGDAEAEEDVEESEYHNDETGYPNVPRTDDELMEGLEEAAYNIDFMENSPLAMCRHPQPSVLYIEDPQNLSRQFYPQCTIVYRCRNDTGCCGRDAECAPKTVETIVQAFLVVTLDSRSDTVLPASQMVERLAFDNHTECECRQKKRLPDCTQKCPGVFTMYRYGWRCVCDCVVRPNERFPQCENVKNGLTALSQDDLVCIKSGKCGKPKCSVGEFNVSTGYCPIQDPHGLDSELMRARQLQDYRLRHTNRKSVIEGSGDG